MQAMKTRGQRNSIVADLVSMRSLQEATADYARKKSSGIVYIIKII